MEGPLKYSQLVKPETFSSSQHGSPLHGESPLYGLARTKCPIQAKAIVVGLSSEFDFEFVVVGFFNGTIRVFVPAMPMQQIKVRGKSNGSSTVEELALNVTNRILAVRTWSRTVHLYHITKSNDGEHSEYTLDSDPFDVLAEGKWGQEPSEKHDGHTRQIEGMCFSLEDEGLLATCSWDSTVRFWNLRSDGSAGIGLGQSKQDTLLSRKLPRSERNEEGRLRAALCYKTSTHAMSVKAVSNERFCVVLYDGSIEVVDPSRTWSVFRIHDPTVCQTAYRSAFAGRGPCDFYWELFPRGSSSVSPHRVGKWACLAFDWGSGSLLLFKVDRGSGQAPTDSGAHRSTHGAHRSTPGAHRSTNGEPHELFLECSCLVHKYCSMAWRRSSRKGEFLSRKGEFLARKEESADGRKTSRVCLVADLGITQAARASCMTKCLGVLTAVDPLLNRSSEAYRVLVDKTVRRIATATRSDPGRVEMALRLEPIGRQLNLWKLPRVALYDEVILCDRVFAVVPLCSANYYYTVKTRSRNCHSNRRSPRDEAVTLCASECGLAIVATSESAGAALRSEISSLPDILSVFCP